LTLAYPATDAIAGVRSIARRHTMAACETLEPLEQSPARACLVQMAQALVDRNR